MCIILIIEHLADHKEYVDTVVDWICKEFGDENNHEFSKA